MNKNIFHILVVDDDNRIRELVKEYLEENNFLITTAKDSFDAKKKLEIIKFDLIVLDIMMPGQSGLSLTKEIKKDNSMPIILLTAKGETVNRIEGLEVGADDYLPKPFEPPVISMFFIIPKYYIYYLYLDEFFIYHSIVFLIPLLSVVFGLYPMVLLKSVIS